MNWLIEEGVDWGFGCEGGLLIEGLSVKIENSGGNFHVFHACHFCFPLPNTLKTGSNTSVKI